MASQNNDILLTIKSMFKGEGFDKANNAIKSTSKSAKTATDSIQKVTNALGTMGGQAGKVAGALGGLFQSFAHGGAIGLAIAGITTAFSFVMDKIEETKKKAEESAKKIAESFIQQLQRIPKINDILIGENNTSLQSQKSDWAFIDNKERDRRIIEEDIYVQEHSPSANTPKLDADIMKAQTKLDIENKRYDYLNKDWLETQSRRDIELQANEQNRKQAEVTRNQLISSRNKLNAEEQQIVDFNYVEEGTTELTKDRQKRVDDIYKAREIIDNSMKNYEEGGIYSEGAFDKNKQSIERKYFEIGSKINVQMSKTINNITDAVKELQIAKEAKVSYQANAFRNFYTQNYEKVKYDDSKVQKRIDQTIKDDNIKEKEDLTAEEERLNEERLQKSKEWNEAIERAKNAANATAQASEDMRNAIAGGMTLPEYQRQQGESEKDKKNNLEKAKRNLLGKLNNARTPEEINKWRKQWQQLVGINPDQQKADDLQQQRDKELASIDNSLQAIKNQLQNVGL